MDAPDTIAGLRERIDEAYADFSTAIDALTPGVLTAPNTIGDWSARNVLAHVGADEQWMAGQLEAWLAGAMPTVASCYGSDEPAPKSVDLATQDGRNAWQRERLRGLSLDEVRQLGAEGHGRLGAVIESLSDKQLSEPLAIVDHGTTGHVRGRKDGEEGWPLWEWLRGVTYHHYADHSDAIRALAAEGARKSG